MQQLQWVETVVSLMDNLCLEQTVWVCHRQYVSVTDSMYLSQTVCICHRQSQGSAIQCSAVCCALQCSVPHITAQCSAVYCTLQCSVLYITVQCINITVQSIVHYSTAVHYVFNTIDLKTKSRVCCIIQCNALQCAIQHSALNCAYRKLQCTKLQCAIQYSTLQCALIRMPDSQTVVRKGLVTPAQHFSGTS